MSELFEEISSGTGKFNSIYFCLRQNRSVAPVSVGQHERCADTSTLLPHTHHGSWDEPWTAAKGLWRSAAALWVGTRYSVRGNPEKTGPQRWNQEAWPRGPRRRGPTAPGRRARSTSSTADIFLRFGSTTTSKSGLIVFDCMIIQRCSLSLSLFFFSGGKILSFNHTYLIAAIGATLIEPCLSSAMVMIIRLRLTSSGMTWPQTHHRLLCIYLCIYSTSAADAVKYTASFWGGIMNKSPGVLTLFVLLAFSSRLNLGNG